MFKLIFGLVISGFILFIIFYFLGSYTDIQNNNQQAAIMKNFLKTTSDVYMTGNPVSFTDFSKQSFVTTFDITEPEGIISGTGKNPVYYPLFFSFGDKVFIYRNVQDLGWWKLRYVEVMPRKRIIFNVINNDWDLVKDIVNSLPDSEFFKPEITFGICDGLLLQEDLCSDKNCERSDFLFYLSSPPKSMSNCETKMPEGAVLITVSSSCSFSTQGICLSSPNSDNVGNMYIKGFENPVIYKDPIDIVSALIGGEKDIYGNSGITMYQYKNNVFREELLFASKIMSNRALLLGSRYPQTSECYKIFADFINTMNSLESTLSNEDYYKEFSTITSLKNKMEQAKKQHQELVNLGCDYQ